MIETHSVPFDLIIYGVVAAVLVVWLRSVLGTRHGGEKQRPNPFTVDPTQAADTETAAIPPSFPHPAGNATADNNVIDINGKRIYKTAERLQGSDIVIDDRAQDGLAAIHAQDKSFDLARFFIAAQSAFEIIVESFAKGDRATLKDLLEPSLYRDFETAITARERRQETLITDILAIRAMTMMDANVRGTLARITILYRAEEIVVTRNSTGQVIEGNPDKPAVMQDIWIFERDLRSRDPVWRLIQTEEAGDR